MTQRDGESIDAAETVGRSAAQNERIENIANIILSLFVLVVFVWAWSESVAFRPQAQTFPRVVIGIGVVLLTAHVVIAAPGWLRGFRNTRAPSSLWMSKRKELAVLGTVLGFALLVAVTGPYFGVAGFLLVSQRHALRQSGRKRLTIALAVVIFLGLLLVIEASLGVEWPQPIIDVSRLVR